MKYKILSCAALFMAAISTAQAGIVVGATRVIYDASKKESTLNINNPDQTPYLIQSWIDGAEGGNSKAPFVITPPLFRLDGNQQNVLRIVRAGNLPADHESMFWLNVKSIPSTAKAITENSLQIAVKTRIKLIYRPEALNVSSAENEVDKLTWTKSGNNVVVNNPTNYYMNFNNIKVNGVGLKDVKYAAPHSSAQFAAQGNVNGSISFALINDFGSPGKQHSASFK